MTVFVLCLVALVCLVGASTSNMVPFGSILLPLCLIGLLFLYNKGKKEENTIAITVKEIDEPVPQLLPESGVESLETR